MANFEQEMEGKKYKGVMLLRKKNYGIIKRNMNRNKIIKLMSTKKSN